MRYRTLFRSIHAQTHCRTSGARVSREEGTATHATATAAGVRTSTSATFAAC